MTDTCTACGRTGSQAMADARSLGLELELQSGVYTCCQIAEWADEQSLAWFEATQEDGKRTDRVTEPLELEAEAVLVHVRSRRPQVPWFRSPDRLRR